jgi:hypothetical protein
MARRHEKDASQLRDRLSEVEPLLTETQQERTTLQKQSEQSSRERSELLLKVFMDINKFLGSKDTSPPANFGTFRDTLLVRLKAVGSVRVEFERKVKETEQSVEHRMTYVLVTLLYSLEEKRRLDRRVWLIIVCSRNNLIRNGVLSINSRLR